MYSVFHRILDLKTGLDFYPGPFFLTLKTFNLSLFMRIALSIILYILLLTCTSSASPKVSTGAFPDWLAAIHPEQRKNTRPRRHQRRLLL
jgi:hypothetical protein